jgi:hypothetical protein
LKSLRASRVGEISIPPSKLKLPTTEASKAGSGSPAACTTAAIKSVSRPVATLRWPLSVASGAILLAWPSKVSVPLWTFNVNLVSWPPLSFGAPTSQSNDSGTPFTVAVPAIENGPSSDLTEAVAWTFSALVVLPVCGLV